MTNFSLIQKIIIYIQHYSFNHKYLDSFLDLDFFLSVAYSIYIIFRAREKLNSAETIFYDPNFPHRIRNLPYHIRFLLRNSDRIQSLYCKHSLRLVCSTFFRNKTSRTVLCILLQPSPVDGSITSMSGNASRF